VGSNAVSPRRHLWGPPRASVSQFRGSSGAPTWPRNRTARTRTRRRRNEGRGRGNRSPEPQGAKPRGVASPRSRRPAVNGPCLSAGSAALRNVVLPPSPLFFLSSSLFLFCFFLSVFSSLTANRDFGPAALLSRVVWNALFLFSPRRPGPSASRASWFGVQAWFFPGTPSAPVGTLADGRPRSQISLARPPTGAPRSSELSRYVRVRGRSIVLNRFYAECPSPEPAQFRFPSEAKATRPHGGGSLVQDGRRGPAAASG